MHATVFNNHLGKGRKAQVKSESQYRHKVAEQSKNREVTNSLARSKPVNNPQNIKGLAR